MNRFLPTIILLATLSAPSIARAADDAPTPRVPPPFDLSSRVHLGGGIGGFETVIGNVGFVFDHFAILCIGPLAVGGNVQLGVSPRDSYIGAAPMAGLLFPTPSWVDFGLLGTVGVHWYTLGATLPFAGARVVLAFAAGKKARFRIGVHGFVDSDLGRERVTYTYISRPDSGVLINWGGDDFEETVITERRTIGTVRMGGLLVFGARL